MTYSICFPDLYSYLVIFGSIWNFVLLFWLYISSYIKSFYYDSCMVYAVIRAFYKVKQSIAL